MRDMNLLPPRFTFTFLNGSLCHTSVENLACSSKRGLLFISSHKLWLYLCDQSNLAGYGGTVSNYNRPSMYGGVGSTLGGYGSSYGGYGSSNLGLGGSYGGYGSTYGGVGSTYGGVGSSYGGSMYNRGYGGLGGMSGGYGGYGGMGGYGGYGGMGGGPSMGGPGAMGPYGYGGAGDPNDPNGGPPPQPPNVWQQMLQGVCISFCQNLQWQNATLWKASCGRRVYVVLLIKDIFLKCVW